MKFWRRSEPRERPAPDKAAEALKDTRRDLERTKAETAHYAALGDSLREIRERNHLTELFLSIHRERR